MGKAEGTSRRRRARSRGAVLVEYALLLTFFAIPVMGGLVIAGSQMLTNYQNARERILAPTP